MFYIYIEVRYKKQLEKINSNFIEQLFNKIENNCTDNGGKIMRRGNILFAGFEEDSIGYLFGAARTLLTVRNSLEENIKRIGEYTVLADISTLSEENVFQSLRTKASRIIRETGIFCLPSAASLLAEYLTFTENQYPLMNGSICEAPAAAETVIETEVCLPLFAGEKDDLSAVLRNYIGILPEEEIIAYLSEDERQELFILKSAVEAYQRRQFTISVPDYIRNSFISYCRLHYRGAVMRAEQTGQLLYFYLADGFPHSSDFMCELKGFFSPAEVRVPDICSTENIDSIKNIPSDLLELAWLLYRSMEFVYADELYAFFSSMGKKKGYLDGILDLLRRYGIVSDEKKAVVLYGCYKNSIRSYLGERRKPLDYCVGQYLWGKYLDGSINPGIVLYKILNELYQSPPVSFLMTCVYSWLESEPWNKKDSPFSPENLEKSLSIGNPEAKKIQRICRCRQLFLDAVSDDRNEIEKYIAEAGTSAGLADYFILLECGEWLYSIGDIVYAAAIVKSVLQKFQHEKNRQGECRCFTLLALIDLARGGVSDAAAYFEYASSSAEPVPAVKIPTTATSSVLKAGSVMQISFDRLYYLKTRYNLACIHFLEGNFSYCLRILNSITAAADELFAREWQVLIYFLQGRCYFELGQYRESDFSFNSGAVLAGESAMEQAAVLCTVWQGRIFSCTNRSDKAEKIFKTYMDKTPDAFLFFVESCIIQHKNTVEPEEVKKTLQWYYALPVWHTEHIYWSSGFRFLEDRYFIQRKEHSIGVRLLHAFYVFYKAVLPPNDTETARRELSLFSRTEHFVEMDPYNYFYTFLLYLAEIQAGQQNSLDQNTLLSKSFKLLQKRANHIDEFAIRAEFLQKPFWICRLYAEARKNMLI